jgi:hypothetical protein
MDLPYRCTSLPLVEVMTVSSDGMGKYHVK